MSGGLRRLRRQAAVGHDVVPLRPQKATPFGERKTSDVFLDFAQPLMDLARGEEETRLAATIAATCWNLALLPRHERPAMLKDLLDKAIKPGQPSSGVEQTIEEFVARKEALFPNDKRVILDYPNPLA